MLMSSLLKLPYELRAQIWSELLKPSDIPSVDDNAITHSDPDRESCSSNEPYTSHECCSSDECYISDKCSLDESNAPCPLNGRSPCLLCHYLRACFRLRIWRQYDICIALIMKSRNDQQGRFEYSIINRKRPNIDPEQAKNFRELFRSSKPVVKFGQRPTAFCFQLGYFASINPISSWISWKCFPCVNTPL